jgi:hypothetical protein
MIVQRPNLLRITEDGENERKSFCCLGPLSLVSIIESYFNVKVAAPGLENRDYGHGDPLRWPRDTFYQLNLALTSPKSGGRSVGIVRLRVKATEFSFFFFSLVPWGPLVQSFFSFCFFNTRYLNTTCHSYYVRLGTIFTNTKHQKKIDNN